MFEREIRLLQFAFGYLQVITKDIDEARLNEPVGESANPPAWILAHLAIANDSALKLLGRPPICPPAWHEAFGIGKKPEALQIPYPSKQELLSTIEKGVGQICEAAKSADATAMNQPTTIPLFQNTPIQTLGDVLALLMTNHFSTHIGQLSLMRRQLGFNPIF